MPITTSFQVRFGLSSAEAQGHLSAEIDDRPTGRNGGQTSFTPGETAYFLVYKSANVTYNTPVPSAGGVARLGAEVVEKEDDIAFADSNEASLPIPAQSIVSVTWLGNSLGALALDGQQTIRASGKGVAVARVRYRANADVWSLASPASVAGLTDFSILVYILGNVTGA